MKRNGYNTNYIRIWETVKIIPEGCVASYGQIADLAGLLGRARLAGKALSETPAEIQLPWHRVLRSSGELAFAKGTEKSLRQKVMLMNEQVSVKNNRVKMRQYQWKPTMEEFIFRLKY
ncbi:MAG TPA: cysteine methyltransferase [Aeromonadales bacterium]|nr:cysteine methyltransferase [Aeromonadales bacterium]